MSILDRYLFKNVLIASLVALLIFVVLDTFFNLLRELENLGRGDYGMDEVLWYLLLTSPRRIYEILPAALLIGGLMGIGNLAANSEIAVMRAAGLSPPRLALSALYAGLVLSLIGMSLGEFLAPHSERLAQQLRQQAKAGSDTYSAGGFWARDGELFIHVDAVLPGQRLIGVDIYEFDETAALKSITRAQTAQHDGQRWTLQSVTRSLIQPAAVSTEAVPQIAWDSVISPASLAVLAADPQDLAIRELLTYIGYLRNSGLDARLYSLAFWKKALAPLTHLALLFVALAFAFVPHRRTGAGQRLLIGVLLGLAFFLLDRLIGNAVLLTGAAPLSGAVLPLLLFFLIGLAALQRVR